MIEGVVIRKLEISSDERGFSYPVFANTDGILDAFGDIHVSSAYPGVVKAWHGHDRKEECIFCVCGMAKLVLFDRREGSPTRGEVMELFLGEHRPLLVKVPAGVFHGYKCISDREALLVVVSSEPYDPEEPDVTRLPHDSADIPYDWKIRMG